MPHTSLPNVNAVCGVVVLRPDGSALLQLRDDIPTIADPGLWVFPGGHVELGESLEDGARRELLEETCYRCGELFHLVTCDARALGYDKIDALTFFWCMFDGVQQVKCCEGQQIRFVVREGLALLRTPDYLPRIWDLALAASGLARNQREPVKGEIRAILSPAVSRTRKSQKWH